MFIFIKYIYMEYLPGICAGISQILIGHPIDTAKVLIQNKMNWYGFPIRDYYRGFGLPLTSSIVFNSIAFPVHKYMYNLTDNHLLSGAVSGFLVTPFVFPLENIKISLQAKKTITFPLLKTTNSFYTTLTGHTIAMSVYFATYHKMREHNYNAFISGCASGLANWMLTYPLDAIRSRQIVQNINFSQACKQGNLFKGLHFALIRAVLVNGSIFYTYENVSDFVS